MEIFRRKFQRVRKSIEEGRAMNQKEDLMSTMKSQWRLKNNKINPWILRK
jgi:hypothetical protein